MTAEIAHDGNDVAVILMVSGMIAHRNRLMNDLLKKFGAESDRMHRDSTPRSAGRRGDDLIAIADRIHGLAQDNGYDMRKLVVYLARSGEDALNAGGNTGHHGQVCYIQ